MAKDSKEYYLSDVIPSNGFNVSFSLYQHFIRLLNQNLIQLKSLDITFSS